MEQDAASANKAGLISFDDSDERPRSAVNSVILDYYKKFGRKRDLEQYFSLSTAQNDIKDPTSLFWRRMKDQSDTSDSGEKKSESSTEICRISIRCSIPETSEAEKRDEASNNDSESPPIITDVVPTQSPSGDESIDDNHSQKSIDANLDTSINKPLSPTSSITSQRKLEWDSLADVGYGNESDRKTSASSLSTLEREVLAQKQQYTLDYKQNSDLGVPTAHSTPVDPNDSKHKGSKGQGKKTISISRKDVDFVEVNVPHNMENVQPINVNLTKQFSVNLQKDGGMTIDNFKKNITVSPEKNVAEVDLNAGVKFDKEIQTSLLRTKEKYQSPVDHLEKASTSTHKNPILIGLNTLKRKQRRKKIRKTRIKLKSIRKHTTRQEIRAEKDKNAEQVSEAESFEYMPGHMYNQNQLKTQDQNRSNNNSNIVGNKSSLESSAVHTTDSSKESKYSFSKDLDKTLNVLKLTLKEKYDSNLKKKLVKEIIQRLLKSNYGEGETTPDFLSVLSLASKKTPTTSTSEADNTQEKVLHSKPKKSILRLNKFDHMNVASTSQSAPNLTSALNSDKPVMSYLSKKTSSTTETDVSNNSAKDGSSSDTVFARTSSEELYKKYIDALKKEEAYKQHLRDKELFLKQKLVRSEHLKKMPLQPDLSRNTKLKELMKDLTRNNYDDGSGDASKLEGGSSSNFDITRQRVLRKHRSHSVFTLSSGNSDINNQSCNMKNRLQKKNANSPRAGPSNWDRNMVGSCKKPAVTDSSVQVNINDQDKQLLCSPPNLVEEAKYICFCTDKTPTCPLNHNEMNIHKCPNQITASKNYCVSNQPLCGMQPPSSHPRKDKPIIECTRCLQTKISIHPKISDPSVSDLNIIHSAECVKLIEELYKKVSQTNSECQCSSEKYECNSYTCKSSKDNIRRNEDRDRDNLIGDVNDVAPLADEAPIEQNVILSCVGCQKIFTNRPESISDNIVIPIQGTNMMLKLSIGGKTINREVQDKQISNEIHCHINKLDGETETDKIKTNLKGTSDLDDCSKSVQARSSCSNLNRAAVTSRSLKTNHDKEFSPREPTLYDHNNEKLQEMKARNNNYGSVPDPVHTSGRNTYPKKVQITEKKSLLRSNTDTGNLGACSGVQTDAIYTKDKETTPSFRSEMDQILVPENQPKSKGGCGTQLTKETPSEHSISESSKSSTDEKFQSFHSLKKKHLAEWQKPKEKKVYEDITDEGKPNDLILDVIKGITRRYSKREADKRSKKKCFKEIMTTLSYLLDTDESGDGDQELSKRSQTSKGVQYSTQQSSESELFSERLNEAERNKTASSRKNSKTRTSTANIRQTSDRDKELEYSKIMESRNRVLVKSNMGRSSSAAQCAQSSRSENHETRSVLRKEPTNENTCICGCGFSDCKECMTSHSTEATSSGKESRRMEELSKQTSEKNKMYAKESLNRGDSYNPSDKIKTCEMGSGCDGSSDCKDCDFPKSPKPKTSLNCKESAKSNTQEAIYNLRTKETTCDKECGCDGSSECKDCVEQHSAEYGAVAFDKESVRPNKQESRCNSPKATKATCDKGSTTGYRTGTCNKESMRSEKQESRCNSPEETKTTCDRGCGCDGSSECKDCAEPHSPKSKIGKESSKSKNRKERCKSPKTTTTAWSKKQERCISPIKPKTCDKGCGCDGSSECNECGETHSLKFGTGKCGKDSMRSKRQDRCSSLKKTITTCDKGCGCDGSSECNECGEPRSPKSRTRECGIDSKTSKRQDTCSSPKKTKTACDKGCGCDGSSECNECGEPRAPKSRTRECGIDSKTSKRQDTCSSPKKTKTTCDKGCGCDGLSECNECGEPRSPKSGIGKCGKQSMRSKKQEMSNSPKKPETCDRGCGCDGSSECSECIEPHSRKYGNNKCSRESMSSTNVERCISPKKTITCDKTCGCDGASECKNCNHKTGRCGKETLRCKRQDAKKFVNKCMQSTVKRVKSLYSHCDDSSDMPVSTDHPCCSTDSPTSKLVYKIKKECEKYQKRNIRFCKKSEASSSTTVSCDHCKRADKYQCRHHKCRCHRSRSTEKIKKKCVAYNLIVQTSDSLISEEAVFDKCRKLQNVVIRVPKCKQANIPFKEACAKIEQKLPYCDTRFEPKGRSQSWPNECGISSTDDVKIAKACTVREYLERNRPDFIDRCATRQNCIRMTSECRAKERSELREQLVGLGSLPSLSNEELEYLATQLGYRRNRPLKQKIMSERDMKKHSEKIYKSLPEVIQKKEDAKKESMKKTNLLMANIFKKNLQKKVLNGDVNISNYSQVVKI